MEDKEIIDLYWQRSDRAIAETDRKYGRYCGTIAYNICRSREDAEECVGDTWFRAWGLMPDKRPGILSSFLGGITRSLALDRYRSQHRQKRGGGETALALEELAECIPGGAEPARVYEQKELAEAIGRFVEALPREEQQALVCRYWYMASIEEIGRATGFGKSKVKSLLFRSRKRLAARLREEGLC